MERFVSPFPYLGSCVSYFLLHFGLGWASFSCETDFFFNAGRILTQRLFSSLSAQKSTRSLLQKGVNWPRIVTFMPEDVDILTFCVPNGTEEADVWKLWWLFSFYPALPLNSIRKKISWRSTQTTKADPLGMGLVHLITAARKSSPTSPCFVWKQSTRVACGVRQCEPTSYSEYAEAFIWTSCSQDWVVNTLHSSPSKIYRYSELNRLQYFSFFRCLYLCPYTEAQQLGFLYSQGQIL